MDKLSQPIDTKILSDNHYIGEMKASENESVFSISKGEHAIQVEINVDGENYRSNIFFAMGSSDVKLRFVISGTRVNLLFN